MDTELQEVPAVLGIQIHHIEDRSIHCPVLLSLLSSLDFLFHLSSHSGQKSAKSISTNEVEQQTNKYDFNWLNWLNFESRTGERFITYLQSVDIKV